MVETIAGILGLVVILGGVILGIWTLRHQSRQYPKGTRIPMDEQRKSEARSSAWMTGGGRG
jgi:hypothetical protein